jgi:hypothetical protein
MGTPFFQAVAAHNELAQARWELEPSYYEPPFPPSPEEAQTARDLAAQAAVDQAGRVAAAEARWAQIQAEHPAAAAAVEAEAQTEPEPG